MIKSTYRKKCGSKITLKTIVAYKIYRKQYTTMSIIDFNRYITYIGDTLHIAMLICANMIFVFLYSYRNTHY